MSKSISASFFALAFAISGLHGQIVAALPGLTTSGSNANGYTASSLTLLNSITAGPNAFTVLAKPDGTKYYIIANSGSNTVTAVDSNFSNPRTLASFGKQATAAAITADGTRLVVAAGALQIIDTTTDQTLATNGVNTGSNAYDVALSLDGATAFVLGQGPTQGTILTAVDIKSLTVKGSINIGGAANAVAVGPNGLIYVSTINQVVEAVYANSTLTQSNVIGLNANPTRLVFTSDGLYAAATNLTPRTGSSVQLYNLSSHTVSNTVPSFGVTLDQIVSSGVNSFIAYSQSAQGLYTINLTSNGNLVINALTVSGLPGNTITGFALSNEIGVNAGAVTSAHYLFVSTPTTVYRVDLNSSSVVGQTSPTFPVGAVSFAAPALVNALPATLLTYGSNQPALAQGASSLPLVVRVLDATGLPISGVAVAFSTTAGTLASATATTGSSGYAQTSLVAPASGGPVTVTATASSLMANIVLQVAGATGTGGTPTAALSIVAGQGQLLYANTTADGSGFGSQLIVKVANADGTPAVSVPVIFSIIQGQLSLGNMNGTPTGVLGQISVPTDKNGQAAVTVTSSNLADSVNGFDSNVVTASAPNTNTVTFYETTTNSIGVSNSVAQPTIFLLSPAAVSTLTGPAGSVLKGGYIVRVISGSGIPIPNVSLILANPADPTGPTPASCVDATGTGVLSDSSGTITCDFQFQGQIGLGQVEGFVGYTRFTPVVNVRTTQGLPAKVTIIDGNNQTGRPGQLLPKALLVQVTDAFGNPLPSAQVSFAASPANAVKFTNVSSSTDGNARASAQVTLGNTAGAVKVIVTAGTATATFNLNITVPIASISVVSGNNQTATVSTAFSAPLVVQAVDTNNSPVSGVSVAYAVTSGNATLSTAAATTGTNGQAFVTATAGSTPGNIVVTASASGFSTQFTLVASPVAPPTPTIAAIVNGASFQPGASPGSIVTITGTNFANSLSGVLTPTGIVQGPLPTTLGGVTVTFNGTAAPIYSVSNINGAQQVTVQVPFELAPGQVSVIVSSQAGFSAPTSLTLAQFSPGVFFTTINGQPIAVAIRSDGSYVTPANPARQGENIMIFLTGLGSTKPTAITGTQGQGQKVIAPMVTGLNNAGVPLISALLTPNLVGVYAVTLTVPIGTMTGAVQPIGVIVYDANNTAFFAQSTYIPIQ